MDKREEFLKALKAAENGEISREELLSITKKIIREMSPEPIAEEKVEEFAKSAIDPSSCTIMISSPNGPPYGGVSENKQPKEWILNRFTRVICEFRDGVISRDKLLEEMKTMAAEVNPGLSGEFIVRLGEAMTDAVNCDAASLDYNKIAENMPDGRYNMPDLGVLQVGAPMEDKMDILPETQAKLDKLLARVDELIPPVETVRLKPSRGKTTLFDSKLGGVPYLPKSMEYPTVRGGEYAGKPLYFLAQLNFGELPKLPGFPAEGILQFFAGCEGDDVYGLDFDNRCNQNTFRVIYHESIIIDESKLYSEKDMPDFGGEEDPYPFKGEFLLTAEKAEPIGISMCDFRADKVVTAAYNELFGGDVDGMWGRGKGIYDVDKDLLDAICTRDGAKTRMGGFPVFTQDDPRGYNDEYAKCTVMLFQSDSENGGEKDNWNDMICWGDLGVGNFFISPEDLAKRDFSHVLYNWDCG